MAPRRTKLWPLLWLASLWLAFLTQSQAIADNTDSVDPLNPEAAYGSTVKYGIYRNNKRIGDHTVDFIKENNELLVSVSSKLVVTVLKIPVYRFNYTANERWQDGVLQQVDAKVTEKGKTKEVSLQRQSDKTLLTEPSGKVTEASLDFASNHWHAGVLQTPAIFNTLTGKENKITITRKGSEQLQVGKQRLKATHYQYSGQLQTDVWYDERLRWVKLRFKGSDGSIIEYRCEGFNT